MHGRWRRFWQIKLWQVEIRHPGWCLWCNAGHFHLGDNATLDARLETEVAAASVTAEHSGTKTTRLGVKIIPTTRHSSAHITLHTANHTHTDGQPMFATTSTSSPSLPQHIQPTREGLYRTAFRSHSAPPTTASPELWNMQSFAFSAQRRQTLSHGPTSFCPVPFDDLPAYASSLPSSPLDFGVAQATSTSTTSASASHGSVSPPESPPLGEEDYNDDHQASRSHSVCWQEVTSRFHPLLMHLERELTTGLLLS
jgi:hypothetical protein